MDEQTDATPRLIDTLRRVLREERVLILTLDRNLFDGQPLVRIQRPGKTERSKPVDVMPVIIGADTGAKHSELLHILADIAGQEGR